MNAPWTLFLVFFFGGLLQARADIVFVNVNGGQKEISAVRQTAAQLGERVYVVPDQDGQVLDTKGFMDAIANLARQGVRPHAMIVSGHHSNYEGFYGSNGKISLPWLKSFLPQDAGGQQSVTDFFASIRSLYLWGCYTGAHANVTILVGTPNTLFTNAQFVVGFGEKAPLSTNPVSGLTLQAFLSREPQFLAANSQQLELLLQAIPSEKESDFILLKGDVLVTNSEAHDENQAPECTKPEFVQSFRQNVQLIWQYFNGALPIPKDTSGGPLRQAYTRLQHDSYCVSLNSALSDGLSVPSTARVVRTVLYQNVIQNFMRIYSSKLATAQQEFTSGGFHNLERLTALDQDRSADMQLIQSLKAELNSMYGGRRDVDSLASFHYYALMIDDIQQVVYPDDHVVPFSWVEPGANELGTFTTLNDFAAAKQKARQRAEAGQ